jgi:regulator of protease activity HflC (stomatin/prohibitin superfamily)
MDSAFAWIGNIVEWLGNFIPRIKIVRSTHGGLRFRRGKIVKEIKPGLCVYLPLITEVDIIPVARQTHNLPSQSLLTKDGKQVVVGGVVVYSIKDVVACLSRNWDVADTINDITMLAIAEVVTKHAIAHLLDHLTDDVQGELTRVTRRKLSPFGVRVYRTALTDFSTCMTIRNVGGGSLIPTHNME